MIDPDEIRFDTTFGQDGAIGLLKRAIRRGRVGHAYLFAGPEGVGKRRTAYAFAATLLCETGGEQACGTCRSCRKFLAGNHPDFHQIFPEGQFIKKEAVGELIRQTQFAPFESSWKIFVLHEAHRLNPYSANALLKTLEEPTKDTVIILVSSVPQTLLPTILSRCQKVSFGPLQARSLTRLLVEKRELDEKAAGLFARLSEGSVGRALSMEKEFVFEKRPELGRAFFSLRRGKEASLLDLAGALFDWPLGLDDAFEVIKTFLSDAVRLSAGAEQGRLTHPDLAEEAAAFASGYETKALAAKIRSVSFAQRLLFRNANKRLTAEALLLDVINPRVTQFADKLPR